MRLITANYLLLPGYPLMKYGWVRVKEGRVVEVVDTGGIISERAGLEFYGGMLVAAEAIRISDWKVGDPLLRRLSDFYATAPTHSDEGLGLIEGADLSAFRWLRQSRVIRLL